MNPWNDGKSWVKIQANLTQEQIKYIEFLVKEARREALKEMDEAICNTVEVHGAMGDINDSKEVQKLRQEYLA